MVIMYFFGLTQFISEADEVRMYGDFSQWKYPTLCGYSKC